MQPTTVLCRQVYAQRVDRRDPRPARVDVTAERLPLGMSPRYRVQLTITTSDARVFKREPRLCDDPKRVLSALDAAQYEFGDMPLVSDQVVGGSDPDAHLFH